MPADWLWKPWIVLLLVLFFVQQRIWRFDLTNHWIQFLSWNLIKKKEKLEASNGKLEKLNSPKKWSQVSKKNWRPGLLVAMLAPMYTSGSSGQIGHAGEAVGSRDQLRVKQWPWRELRAAAFFWRYSTGYLRRGQEMRTDNTTSSGQPKNPKFQTSADLQISPNTESVCFYLQKLLQNLGLMSPGTTRQVPSSRRPASTSQALVAKKTPPKRQIQETQWPQASQWPDMHCSNSTAVILVHHMFPTPKIGSYKENIWEF